MLDFRIERRLGDNRPIYAEATSQTPGATGEVTGAAGDWKAYDPTDTLVGSGTVDGQTSGSVTVPMVWFSADTSLWPAPACYRVVITWQVTWSDGIQRTYVTEGLLRLMASYEPRRSP